MTTSEKPVEVVRIACEVCLREVPISEATNFEAVDYVVYFCGLECYEVWMSQEEMQEDESRKS
jgi:hypothetical protein